MLACLSAGLLLALLLAWRVRHGIAGSAEALLRNERHAAHGVIPLATENKP